ncbi:hypothetical protein INT44_008281 [Umbelopsis vinacea]|uniref:Uncharacterized protein n=1 Tax=Umbelopsis vinacea TaxID=44442 RepID=A0A8H7PX70_9FUNG|nr:hypothetical protein INT44_008281 [Umbelopsis vinacea]
MKFTLILAAVASTFGLFANAAPLEKRGVSSCYTGGKAAFTQYWIPKEGTTDMLNNGKVVQLTGSKNKSLKTPSGHVIAKVSSTTYEKCQMEGTCLLSDGTMINLDEGQNTFLVVNTKQHPYGLGSSDSISLHPWTSIASNDIKKGTTLYIKEIDGIKLPNGMTHNGCVRVDDESWSFNKCQLDWFVLMYETYDEIANKVGEHVKAVESNCKILDYVNQSTEKWLGGPGNLDAKPGKSHSDSSKKTTKKSSSKHSSTKKSSGKKSSTKKGHSTKKSSSRHHHKHHHHHNKRAATE